MEQDSLIQVKEAIESLDAKIVAAIIVAIASSIVGIITVIFTYRSHKQQIEERRREERRKEIYKKLNDFYGPVAQYLLKSKELYEIFKKDKDDLKGQNEERFRTLTCILRGHKFTGTDAELLKGILAIGSKIEDLIQSKSGLVDSPQLQKLLAKVATHFEMIRNAFNGKYETGTGKDEQFKEYVFPNEIGEKINERIKHLQSELATLNS